MKFLKKPSKAINFSFPFFTKKTIKIKNVVFLEKEKFSTTFVLIPRPYRSETFPTGGMK